LNHKHNRAAGLTDTRTSRLNGQPATVPPREPGRPWPIAEAAEFLCVSERHLARLGKAGKVRLLRFGRRVLLSDAEVRRLATEGP
jgi:excisionase family DNA binding protein